MIFVFDDLRDFGDHVAAALDFDPVADFHAEALDVVHVMQGGAADRGAADGDRLQRRHGREFSGASDLHQDVFDLGDAAARGIFVGDGPARGFAGEAELVLQRGAVDFDDDAVDFVGKGVALGSSCWMNFQTSSKIFASLRLGLTLKPAASSAFRVSQWRSK